jgi:hypothetical protein
MAYKTAALEQLDVCPALGIKLTYDNSHVCYLSPSFEELLIGFLEERSINIESLALTNPKPGDTDHRGQITYHELLKDWCSYHQINTNLQLLSAEANFRRLKS